MQKYPLWKPLTILAVLALCGLMLYPPSRKLKPGLDLAGGTTLVYQVDVPEGMDAGAAVDQVIASYKKRVDPQGVRNLIWRSLAGNRFEVQMAAASNETKVRRQVYVDAKEALINANLAKRDIERALQLSGEARDAELTRLAGDSGAQRELLAELARAADALDAARKPNADLEEQKEEIEQAINNLPADAPEEQRKSMETHRRELLAKLQPAARAYYLAQQNYDTLLEQVLKSNVNPNELDRVLALPDAVARTSRDAAAPADAEQPGKTIRQTAIDRLIADHPSRADAIRRVVEVYLEYEKVKGPLDDPADLISLLRGSGVLEFRIAPSPAELPNAEEYRKQLAEKGPRAGADKPFRWFIIDRDENGNISFAETARARKALEEDPEGFFASQAVPMIGQAYAGEYYLLLGNTRENSLTQAQSGWELSRAFPDMDQSGFPAVSFRLNSMGGSLMGELTGGNIGKPMAIMLDGRVISAPRINDKIHDSGIITGGSGGFGATELNYLIRTLNAGSLQARVSEHPISIKTTGPQLGQDNLRHGLQAAIMSLVAVAVFMIIYYLVAGFVAVFALLANMVIILGVMAMIQATWTLPGIAGIVLTIGMAVDANVLIYERIREELSAGQSLPIALRRGFDKALSTILDANITTLITCVVLYYSATTEVKGFALTLGIGIVATLFSTLFGSRVLLDLYLAVAKPKTMRSLPMIVPAISRALQPNVNWVGKRRLFMTISAIAFVGALILIYSRGQDMLDIEFRSGTEVSFDLRAGQTLSLPEVRKTLDKVAEKFNQPELSSVRARVVTLGATEGSSASAFSIQTLIEDSTIVSRAIKEGFADYLDIERVVSFDKMDVQHIREAPAHIIDRSRLGEIIGRNITDEVSDYLGGVAILLDNMDPPISEKDLTSRIKRMRLQPAYEQLEFRESEVIGLELAPSAGEGLYKSAVVVCHSPTTNYIDDPASFTDDTTGLATTEWNLVRDALTRDTSLSSVSNFSSQISSTMKVQAIQAMVLSLLAIVIYIWLRFGKLTYGLAAIAALVHDVIIALGLVALTHYLYQTPLASLALITDMKIDLALIAALLTLVGYSLNDTIVVFDRIRETRGRLAAVTPAIINDSINQTISRTFLTSFTTLLAVTVLFAIGGEGVHGFAFALLVGVLVGTYSSIAIAAPILLFGQKLVKDEPASVPQTT